MAVNNKATRFNRAMLVGTMFLGLVVIGVCYGFLYYSFDAQQQKNETEAQGDSLILKVEDPGLID